MRVEAILLGGPPVNRSEPSVKKTIAYLTKLKADIERLTLIADCVNMSNVTFEVKSS